LAKGCLLFLSPVAPLGSRKALYTDNMNVRGAINCAITNTPNQRNIQLSDFMPKTLHTQIYRFTSNVFFSNR